MLKEYFILIQTPWNNKVQTFFLFSIFSIWLRPIWCCFGRSFLVKRLNVLNDLRKLFGAVYSIELLGFCDAFPGRIVVLYLGKNWVLPNWVSIFKVRLNFNNLNIYYLAGTFYFSSAGDIATSREQSADSGRQSNNYLVATLLRLCSSAPLSPSPHCTWGKFGSTSHQRYPEVLFVCEADLYILMLLVCPSVTPSLCARV